MASSKEFSDLRSWATSFSSHFLRDSAANPFLVVEALFWRPEKGANAEVARHYGLIDGSVAGLSGAELAAMAAAGALYYITTQQCLARAQEPGMLFIACLGTALTFLSCSLFHCRPQAQGKERTGAGRGSGGGAAQRHAAGGRRGRGGRGAGVPSIITLLACCT